RDALPQRSACRARADALERIERGDHVCRMTLRLDLRPGSRDPPVRPDEERRARDTHVGLAVVLFLDPRTIGFGDRVALVGEKREWQAELLPERPLALHALGADPPHVRAALVDRLVRVTELT